MAAIVPTPPTTLIQTTHALVIRAGGRLIGAVSSWKDNMSRTVTEAFEFGNVTGPYSTEGPQAATSGNPFEKVPGNLSNLTITLRRYEIYAVPFETVFNTPDLVHLSMQLVPIDIEEGWVSPANDFNYRNVYRGCWFSERGRSYESSGDRIVLTDATVHYTGKLRLAVGQ